MKPTTADQPIIDTQVVPPVGEKGQAELAAAGTAPSGSQGDGRPRPRRPAASVRGKARPRRPRPAPVSTGGPFAPPDPRTAQLVEEYFPETVDPIRRAELLLELKQINNYGWQKVADLVGLSHTYVRQYSGLLRLREPVQQLVRNGELPVRTALVLTAVSAAFQVELARRAVWFRWTAEALKLEVLALETE